VILVVGEALVDAEVDGAAILPHPGGGPFNTAVALGRLGIPVTFAGPLADDALGALLRARLAEAGVRLSSAAAATAPTPLALVEQPDPDGDVAYRFYLRGTAFEEIASDPRALERAEAVFVGSLALTVDPPAAAVERFALEAAPGTVLVVDPNVRPAVVAEPRRQRERVVRVAARAGVVKLSRQDVSHLWPGEAAEEIAHDLLGAGARLVVVTDGAAGACGWTRRAAIAVPAPRVEVVDTVGAGDAFTAGLVGWLWQAGRLALDAIEGLAAQELDAMLRYAAAAGAAQCTRPFAWGPAPADLAALLEADAREPTTANRGG
jgi:fructokinase